MSQPTPLAAELELLVGDINGVPRGKVIESASLDDHELQHLAAAVLMQSIDGHYAQCMDTLNAQDHDLLLQPDWSSYRQTPWAEDTAQVICNTINKDTGEPISYDSRNVLKKIIAEYSDMGLSAVAAPELEFYLLEPPGKNCIQLEPAVGEQGWAEFGGEAFSPDALRKYQPFVADLQAYCQQAGLDTSAIVHEMGPAQIELNVEHGDVLDRADQLFMLKRLVKACAQKHGKLASFMAKPLANLPGNGLHVHCSMLNSQGQNVFALDGGKAGPLLQQFIAGLQVYLPKAFALVAPNVNSYKRFVRGVSAPINLAWGYDNRTTGLRVPFGDDKGGRVENRIAGADVDPYLIMAVTLGCGLLGLRKELEPTAPFDGDAYDEEADLPRNLEAALSTLDGSEELRNLFGDDFVDVFVSCKQNELNHMAATISPWEARYLGSML
ncbi:MAG: glutamine synthetase family protein [Pseudomonadales bacterium]